MSPRRATWWRTIGAVVVFATTLGLAPTGAGASAPFSPALIRQSPVAVLEGKGTGQFAVVLDTAGANRATGADVSIYPMVHTLSALSPIIADTGASGLPLSSTGSFRIDCAGGGSTTFYVTVGERSGTGTARPTCGGAHPYLDVACHGSRCAGVYPLEVTTTNGPSTATFWSLLTVTPQATTPPVRLALVLDSNPVTTTMAKEETGALRALAATPNGTAEVAVGYPGLSDAYFSTAPAYASYRTALVRALTSVHHTVINMAPDSTAFAALAAHHLGGDLADQAHLATSLLSRLTSKISGQAVALSGPLTASDLSALAMVHVRSVIVPDADLTFPPSSTLQWGTPLHLAGAPANVTAVTTDTPLATVAEAPAVSAGLRAALTLGELALLHYEAPFVPAPRTVVLEVPLEKVGAAYLRELFDGLAHDPVVDENGIADLFDPSLVGANGDPSTWTLAPSPVVTWSATNTRTIRTLDARLQSLGESITSSLAPATPLHVAVLECERREGTNARQRALNAVSSTVSRILGQFRVDDTTITLAGSGAGATLPITITSAAPYTVTGYLSLFAPNVHFPDGGNVPVTLSTSTTAVRVPANIGGTGNFTLQVRFESVDRRLVFTVGAIQVRSTSTSVVGYAITALALLVIALWWFQTSRRRSRGQHAR